ncbi:MAG: PAS domain S-box protein [Gammaproteobacteria bacterium]|nr:PAS domain S-box protein [Gammaproteobacteria bacterium]NIR84547.1 PAS domain S-box protein [Gammaproteobacteria bacterium]NIR90450.1 PAS domain S-box protein [Gammaproteobacteria bacterium]NIU05598.1 PAS domain S-box protein [Gammaproteobacteria bacterium]NIV52737.1 PAS domain S-box protein [Gammaproteobacteria bacterium]
MKSERLGLMMVASSLLVIALIIGVSFGSQRSSRLSQIRVQGVSLARLLSSMSLQQLIPDEGQQGPLALVKSTQGNPDFAYAVVSRPDGVDLLEIAAPGVIVPAAALPAEPSAWFGEREVADLDGGREFREFHAPVLQGGELKGHVRVGYVEPGWALVSQELPYFAWLALPIFLLTPFYYYLVRREVQPLREASERIQTILDDDAVRTVELEASGEVGEFIRHFNRIVRAAETRINALESEQSEIVASTKVLSYQKARIESVLQSLPEAVVVMDESGSVTFANRKLTAMVGIDAGAIAGMKPNEWCKSPELLAFVSNFMRSTARRNEMSSTRMTPEHAPDREIAVSAYPLFSPSDGSRIYGTMIVFHDVTAESLAKKARKEFVARLAHELKTPLHVIGMYSEMLLDEDKDTDAVRVETGNVIKDEVELIGMLINNMLNIAEIEMGSVSLERQRIRLGDLLKDAFDNVSRSAADRGLKMRLDVSDQLSAVYVDKRLLRVAINNLLTNAIKYNRPNGLIVLFATETEDHILISVRDTGIGIALEDQPRIYTKFFRSAREDVRERTGHGLGLALAKEIVELHQGEMRLESTPGQGSEFTIVLKKTPILLREAV